MEFVKLSNCRGLVIPYCSLVCMQCVGCCSTLLTGRLGEPSLSDDEVVDCKESLCAVVGIAEWGGLGGVVGTVDWGSLVGGGLFDDR